LLLLLLLLLGMTHFQELTGNRREVEKKILHFANAPSGPT